ncbi:Dihydropteroate synthase-like protein [Flammula alnicola]|nr:Dihydropteroate synthase-like protein [Flammula alnicola]
MRDESTNQVGKKSDTIRINDLILPVSLKTGAQWQSEGSEPTEQPISISIFIYHNVSRTANADDLSYSINYSDIAKEIRASVISTPFICLQDLSRHICNAIHEFSSLVNLLGGLEIRIRVAQLKAPLHCKTVAVEHLAKFSSDGSWSAHEITHIVEDLTCPTIVGVGSAERLEKQDVVVNLSINTGEQGLDQRDWIDLRALTRILYEEISKSDFLTLEALTSFLASETLSTLKSYQPSPIVSIRAAKPSALTLARSAEVQVLRTLFDYPDQVDMSQTALPEIQTPTTAAQYSEFDLSKAAIALGSNLGDSFQNIEYALRLLEIPQDVLGDTGVSMSVTVVNTSFLYETAPMYVIDQPSFINCACVVETNLSPMLLLRLLKKIESIVGRVPSIRNGPRAVDLDIIFYDNDVIDTRLDKQNLDELDGELVIPHPRVQEREFVLRPLADMIPNYIHPFLNKTVEVLFKDVCDPKTPPMNKIIPYPRFPISTSFSSPYHSISPVPETLACWSYPSTTSSRSKPKNSKTHVMATLNVTPDSFSDGATHDVLPAALAYACSSVAAGATIIDIGGYSTRPGAAFVSVEDEIRRVVPTVTAMRDSNALSDVLKDNKEFSLTDDLLDRMADVPISVDTFRWEIAEAAIKAGANCINDVYAFTGPDSWPTPQPDTDQGKKAAEYMTKMKAVAREYAVPVVLMHSRGDAGKNKDYSQYHYAVDVQQATLEGVRIELGAKVDQIVLGKGGVRRWLVIADPGIGFSKTLEGNLEVLRGAQDVVADVMIGDRHDGSGTYRNPLSGYPQLIGVSRKSFLGAILAQDPEGRETRPKERTWATAAAVTCAVQQGALIVRVHDVKEMMDVVKVAEALWS